MARFVRPFTLAAALYASAAPAVWADAPAAAAEEVQQLMQAGKLGDAAKRVQRHLKLSPKDVQLRFLQGVIAAEQNRRDDAIQVFTALTRDHPQLPEPYNNLAVLYAAKGDDRKAAQTLEKALATHHSYATAHQNLGDLYARMASDAYAKALLLDSGSSKPAPPKLALIGQVTSSSSPLAPTNAPASRTAAVVATAAAPVVAPAVAAVTAPVTKPTPTAAPAAPSKVSPTAMAPAPVAAAPKEEAVSPAAAAKAAAQAATDKDKAQKAQQAQSDVEHTVNTWARAWAKQDMAGYLASYSPQFSPAGGESLAKWKAERKDRIVGKNSITVQVRDLRVHVQGNKASASFRQFYAAGSFKATTRKVLRMQQEGNKWLIVREETGA